MRFLQIYNIEYSGIRISVDLKMGTSMSYSQKQKLRKHIIHGYTKRKKNKNINNKFSQQIKHMKQKPSQLYASSKAYQNKFKENQKKVVQILKRYSDDYIDLPYDIPSIEKHSQIMNPARISQVDEQSSSQVSQYMIDKSKLKEKQFNDKYEFVQSIQHRKDDIKEAKSTSSQFYYHSSKNYRKVDSIYLNQHQNKIQQIRSLSTDRFNSIPQSISNNPINKALKIAPQEQHLQKQKQKSQSNHVLSQIIQQKQIKYNTINYDKFRCGEFGLTVNSGFNNPNTNNNLCVNNHRRLSDDTYNYQNYVVKESHAASNKFLIRNSDNNYNVKEQYQLQQSKKIAQKSQKKIIQKQKPNINCTYNTKLTLKDSIKEDIIYKTPQSSTNTQSIADRTQILQSIGPQIYHPRVIKSIYNEKDEYQLCNAYANRIQNIHKEIHLNEYTQKQDNFNKAKRSASTNDSATSRNNCSIEKDFVSRPRKLLFF